MFAEGSLFGSRKNSNEMNLSITHSERTLCGQMIESGRLFGEAGRENECRKIHINIVYMNSSFHFWFPNLWPAVKSSTVTARAFVCPVFTFLIRDWSDTSQSPEESETDDVTTQIQAVPIQNKKNGEIMRQVS